MMILPQKSWLMLDENGEVQMLAPVTDEDESFEIRIIRNDSYELSPMYWLESKEISVRTYSEKICENFTIKKG